MMGVMDILYQPGDPVGVHVAGRWREGVIASTGPNGLVVKWASSSATRTVHVSSIAQLRTKMGRNGARVATAPAVRGL